MCCRHRRCCLCAQCTCPPEPLCCVNLTWLGGFDWIGLDWIGLPPSRNPIDQVVGWTVLPFADDTFRPNHGKFKLPLLRGEVDFDIDKCVALCHRCVVVVCSGCVRWWSLGPSCAHPIPLLCPHQACRTVSISCSSPRCCFVLFCFVLLVCCLFDCARYSLFESAMAKDLDRWLANLYIVVRRLPRQRVPGNLRKGSKDGRVSTVLHREFDVEVAYVHWIGWAWLGLRWAWLGLRWIGLDWVGSGR